MVVGCNMEARITVTADANILALNRMLVENGQWIIRVHNRHIVDAVRVPKGIPVESLISPDTTEVEAPSPSLPENHSDSE